MTTRENILLGARKVFERFGFSKASMADIAMAARQGRRTIYSYFTSKEEVFKAVIDTEVEVLAENLEKLVRADIPPDEKLRQYMHIRMNGIKELTMYYDALRHDLLNKMGLVENLRIEYDARETQLIKTILDEGNEKGTFDIPDTQLVADAIVLATKGFELPIFMGRSDFDHDRLIDPLISTLYNGIKRKK
ncbi:MAG: TetR/AcrR family transcriptional regulator [Bacteroidia bacterium]|nr:MAG: TetR/AcrR family transcriptional regulator [Bacteroidia bacterium]